MKKTYNEKHLDLLFKQSLSNKVFLALIMKECINEYKNEDLNTIIQKYIENHIEVGEKIVHPRITGADKEKTDDNKQTTYDINFYARLPKQKDKIGIIINVEAQTRYKLGYHMLNRAHYYNARNISNQFGILFEESDGINRYRFKEEHIYGNVKEEKELIQTFNDLRDHKLDMNVFYKTLKEEYGYKKRIERESEVTEMCDYGF